ncbi:MAG: DUF2235 domain-containing protein [Xanthobacteraceae bacterium]|nr:DUF2235 domain-containing protein [Xanthobacteraceae bacterium]
MKRLAVLCDGTGNEISENISNVLKLYRVLRKTEKTEPRQLVYYDSGVGTLAQPNPWRRLLQDAQSVFGLATGYGLDENVLDAYKFLAKNYQEDDEIYLFGFSRGAHTVRVLAALIHKVGLLSIEQCNLCGAALTAYKQFGVDLEQKDGSDTSSRDDKAAQFARIASTRWPTIKFLGVWDTVASVITPRPDRLYIPSLQSLAFTLENPSVENFRQAIAIDERRRMFRLEPWKEGQEFHTNRFSKTNNSKKQNCIQVWFAGVHADIGGGYPENESAMSKYPLLWMIEEAQKSGLDVNTATVNQLAWGIPRKGSPFEYVAPSVNGDLHDSMNLVWRALEILPKNAKYREWPTRDISLGFYWPLCEPRAIAEGALIHESVFLRMSAVESYRPKNLPRNYQVVPMPAQGQSLA